MQNAQKDSLFGVRMDPTPGRRVTNWRALVGQTVQVWRGDDMVDQGLVETVTSDGNVLWLAQTGPVERRLVAKERGSGLRIHLMS